MFVDIKLLHFILFCHLNPTDSSLSHSSDDGSTPERIALIMGPPDRCQHAAEIISELLRSVQSGGPPGPGGRGRGRGQGNWNMGPPGGMPEFVFTVPAMKTGLIIGKGVNPHPSPALVFGPQVPGVANAVLSGCSFQVARPLKASASSREPG